MVKTYGDRLAEALLIARKERQELASAINISVQAIGQVLVGKTKALTAENSARAARYLGVDGFWLATGMGLPATNGVDFSTIENGIDCWPFTVSLDLFLQMPAEEQRRLDEYVEYSVSKWHMSNQLKNRKTG